MKDFRLEKKTTIEGTRRKRQYTLKYKGEVATTKNTLVEINDFIKQYVTENVT
jgi:hypothetical protein